MNIYPHLPSNVRQSLHAAPGFGQPKVAGALGKARGVWEESAQTTSGAIPVF